MVSDGAGIRGAWIGSKSWKEFLKDFCADIVNGKIIPKNNNVQEIMTCFLCISIFYLSETFI